MPLVSIPSITESPHSSTALSSEHCRQRWYGQEFKVILGFMVSPRVSWVTLDLLQRNGGFLSIPETKAFCVYKGTFSQHVDAVCSAITSS